MSLLLLNNKKKKGIIKDGLVLWLDGRDFTNSPPTSSLRDRSGNGNNATTIGMAYTIASGSDNNGGIIFDGVDDKFTVNNIGDDSVFTIESKFIMSGTSTNKAIISKASDTSTGARFIIDTASVGTKLRFFGFSTTNSIIGDSSGIAVNANSIIHGIFIFDGSNFKTYINGVLQQSAVIVGTPKSITNNFNIGSRLGGEYYDKTIYMVRYYNRVLTDSEILQNYNVSK